MSVALCQTRNGEVPFSTFARGLMTSLGTEAKLTFSCPRINLREWICREDLEKTTLLFFIGNNPPLQQEIVEGELAEAYRVVFQSWFMICLGDTPIPRRQITTFLVDLVPFLRPLGLNGWDVYKAYRELQPRLLNKEISLPAQFIARILLERDNRFLSNETLRIVKLLLVDYCQRRYRIGTMSLRELAILSICRHFCVFGSWELMKESIL